MEDPAQTSRLDYIRIANYYYKYGLTQEEIAQNMSMSRQRVNRILKKCLDLGIVRIEIEGLEKTNLALENKLEKQFGLRAARIATIGPEGDVYREIGNVAAGYLTGVIGDGDVIGFSRGRNVSALVDAMPEIKLINVMVTQLMGGGNGQQSTMNVDDIVHRFSRKTNSASTLLYAPVLVNSRELRDAILREPFFQEAYATVRKCTIAVVGIGEPSHDQNAGAQTDRLSADGRTAPVGEICTHHFDENGRPVATSLDQRVIAVTLDDFLRIPTRIGVAGTATKRAAILGALRGGYVNCLVTDLDTAAELSRKG